MYISKTPCGRLPPPPSLRDLSRGTLQKKMEKELSKKLKIQSRIYIKIFKKKHQKWIQKHEKSSSEGGLGVLGGDLGAKNLSKSVLADFGRFWPGSDRPKSRPNGPRWGQDGAKMLQVGAKMAILRQFGELSSGFLVVLGAIF